MMTHASVWKSVIKVDIVLQYFGSLTSSSITAKLCQILRKEKFVNDCSLRAVMASVQIYCFSHLISKGISFHKRVFMRNVIEKNLQSEEVPCSEIRIGAIMHYSLLSSNTNSNDCFCVITSWFLPQTIAFSPLLQLKLVFSYLVYFVLLLILFNFILSHILVLFLLLLQILLLIMSKHSKKQ